MSFFSCAATWVGFKDINWVEQAPPQLPVSMLDVDRAKGPLAMELPMQDACPACGAFRMQVGDYICWRRCRVCSKEGA